MNFLNRTRGENYCPHCGEEIGWIRLITGMWMAVQTDPVLYIPEAGKMWLIDSKYDGQILKDCLIYKKGLGADLGKIRRGYEPHVYKCPFRKEKNK